MLLRREEREEREGRNQGGGKARCRRQGRTENEGDGAAFPCAKGHERAVDALQERAAVVERVVHDEHRALREAALGEHLLGLHLHDDAAPVVVDDLQAVRPEHGLAGPEAVGRRRRQAEVGAGERDGVVCGDGGDDFGGGSEAEDAEEAGDAVLHAFAEVAHASARRGLRCSRVHHLGVGGAGGGVAQTHRGEVCGCYHHAQRTGADYKRVSRCNFDIGQAI